MKQHLAAIAALNRDALRGQRRDGLTLELDYHPSAAKRVRDWVGLEKDCCRFLEFAIEDCPTLTRVTIVAPPEAGPAAEVMFALFSAASSAEPAAGDSP